MNEIRILVKNSDVVIPRETLRRAGIEAGDIIAISTVSEAESATMAREEDRGNRVKKLRALWGLWSEEDEERFPNEREAMWQSWLLSG